MRSRVLAIVLLCSAVIGPAGAQESSYSGQESRDIKALSPEDVKGLLAGKGMGFAKAAELNGYPGPAHVLELADKLQLQSQQRARTEAIFQRMEAAAKNYGAQLVDAERDLELLFRQRRVDSASLGAAVERIATLQAKVRLAHLQAHLEEAEVLTVAQAALYAQLRGYREAGQPHSHHGHKHE